MGASIFLGYIGDILGLCRDNGIENDNYYITGLYKVVA